MQHEAKKKILDLRHAVKRCGDPELLHQWSKMQTSDHFYYMSTKGGDDGAVHDYFRPYPTAYDGYVYFMNALSDLQLRARRKLDALEAERIASIPLAERIAESRPSRRD